MSVAEGFEEFVVIVDSGSLTAAASVLGLPRPTVSRRLARLEERLGVRLIHRTTRRMKLTQQGATLYEKARRVVQIAREAETEVQRLDGVPRGLLRVSIPAGGSGALFARWFSTFMARWPEVSLDIVASSVHVDLIADGFDVALRVGDVDDTSLVVRTIANDLRVAVASPRYLAEHGTPQRPEDLADHSCIIGYQAGSTPETRWPLRDGGWVPIAGTFSTNHMNLRMELARRHLGIALLIEQLAARGLESGELVAVLPGVLGRRERLSLAYPDRAFLDPKVRVFVDFMAEAIQTSRASRPPRQRTDSP